MFRSRLKRTDPVLEEVLDRHAEALIAGQDRTEEMLREHGAVHPALVGLLPLAGRLQEALKPVEPSDQFVARLKAHLLQAHAGQVRSALLWTPQPDRLLQVSRILGIVVSVLTVIALLVRIASSIFMLVMILSERRRRSTAAV